MSGVLIRAEARQAAMIEGRERSNKRERKAD